MCSNRGVFSELYVEWSENKERKVLGISASCAHRELSVINLVNTFVDVQPQVIRLSTHNLFAVFPQYLSI